MSDWIDALDRKIFPFVEYPGYANRYPTLEALPLPEHLLQEMAKASRLLFSAFCHAGSILSRCDRQILKDMDMPKNLLPYLNLPASNPMGLPTWLSRFDFVLDKEGSLHMVELNADTPCAIVEAFYGNGVAARELGFKDPNAHCQEQLAAYLKSIYLKADIPAFQTDGSVSKGRPFVFACFPDYLEDYGTTLYLMHTMQEAVDSILPNLRETICFASFYDLRVDDDGVLLPDGRHAGALYRLHPMELLAEETATDGTNLGTYLLDGYRKQCFSMMNPPEAILLQCKGFQALLWQDDVKACLTDAQRQAVDAYMLPTYFERDFVPERASSWLKKPIWGREGSGIQLIDKDGLLAGKKEIEDEEAIVQRQSHAAVYQEYVEQPIFHMKTDEGQVPGYLTLSCFLLGKEPSAFYARFSPDAIAGTEAYWAPIAVLEP